MAQPVKALAAEADDCVQSPGSTDRQVPQVPQDGQAAFTLQTLIPQSEHCKTGCLDSILKFSGLGLDGSVIWNTVYSLIGPGFGSQHPHGGSQPSSWWSLNSLGGFAWHEGGGEPLYYL